MVVLKINILGLGSIVLRPRGTKRAQEIPAIRERESDLKKFDAIRRFHIYNIFVHTNEEDGARMKQPVIKFHFQSLGQRLFDVTT